eukprot:6480890-Amphidinium_carterae.2
MTATTTITTTVSFGTTQIKSLCNNGSDQSTRHYVPWDCRLSTLAASCEAVVLRGLVIVHQPV